MITQDSIEQVEIENENIVNEETNELDWETYTNYKGETYRQISELLRISLALCPILFVWVLFIREGYSNNAKIGWALYAVLAPLLWATIGAIISLIFFSPNIIQLFKVLSYYIR